MQTNRILERNIEVRIIKIPRAAYQSNKGTSKTKEVEEGATREYGSIIDNGNQRLGFDYVCTYHTDGG